MPIKNSLFGVWKLLRWFDSTLGINHRYIVESANQGTEQDVTPESFVQGTALPLILNVGGAKATMEISAPLLVGEGARNSDGTVNTDSGTSELNDGYTMWKDVFNPAIINNMFYNNYLAETGFIITSAQFSVNANQGASYSFSFEGDADYLGEERYAGDNGFTLDDGYPTTALADYPIPIGSPLRVASFYDVCASLGSNLSGYLEQFEINYNFQTQGFNYVGQNTQRQILGMMGAEITFQGSMISSTRSPLGYEYPWQAMNADNDLPLPSEAITQDGNRIDPAHANYGGIAKSGSFSLLVYLKNGVSNAEYLLLTPHAQVEDTLIRSSQVQIGNDLIRSQFNGYGWIQSPILVS